VQQGEYSLCPTELEVRGKAIRWTKARHLRWAMILSFYFNNCCCCKCHECWRESISD